MIREYLAVLVCALPPSRAFRAVLSLLASVSEDQKVDSKSPACSETTAICRHAFTAQTSSGSI